MGPWGEAPLKKSFFLNLSKSLTNSLRMLSTQSTISQKLKSTEKKTIELKNPYQNIAHLLERKKKFPKIFGILNDHISKLTITKIGKLFFHSFQNIAQLFGPKKLKRLFLSLTRKDLICLCTHNYKFIIELNIHFFIQNVNACILANIIILTMSCWKHMILSEWSVCRHNCKCRWSELVRSP